MSLEVWLMSSWLTLSPSSFKDETSKPYIRDLLLIDGRSACIPPNIVGFIAVDAVICYADYRQLITSLDKGQIAVVHLRCERCP